MALADRVLQPHLTSEVMMSYGHTITLDLPSQLARQARQIEPEIGLLLPCNAVVRRTPAGPWLDALDPQVTPLTHGGRTHQMYRAGTGQAVVVLP
jgi:hypothetical protein